MAIDMIENNELGAFVEGRLGFKQFTDEKYSSYTGAEDFYNLFGSRNRKKSAIRLAVQEKYQNLPSDCNSIQQSIDLISNDIATLLKSKANLQQRESLDESNIILGQFKKLQISQNCVQKLAQQSKEEERASALSTLSALSEASVGQAKAEITGTTPDDTNKKLLLYGGIGLGALLLIALILKKQ